MGYLQPVLEMPFLLLSVLLATAPAASPALPGPAAFERLKRLEGAWRSKDAHLLTLRVIAGGAAVVETHTSGPGRPLASVTIYRLEAGELVAALDGAVHAVLVLFSAGEKELRFADRAGAATLTLSTPSAGTLEQHLILRGKGEDPDTSGVFTREYLDTLK